MKKDNALRPVSGSDRAQPVAASEVGEVDRDQTIKITVYVRPKVVETPAPTLHEIRQLSHQRMDQNQRAKALEAFEAAPEDIERVVKFAEANKLKVLDSSATKRNVLLEGKIGDAAAAFGVDLKIWQHRGLRYRGRTGPVQVPTSLAGVVEAVFGFDNRPIGRAHFHRSRRRVASHAARTNAYLPTDVAALYDFPSGTDGSHQNIAIMAFNGALGDSGETALGGYSTEILSRYFDSALQLPLPDIRNVVVHGPGNQPGDGTSPTDATGEVLLDICMAGALAPKAKLMMYFTEFTEQGWVDAVTAAVTATDNTPSVISVSYGNPEDGPEGQILWTQQAIFKVDEAFHRAALAGITICVASGDQGSSEQLPDFRQHVDFPASSPWVLACGGTRLIASDGVITSETVWNDGPGSATGGGISRLFAVPSYQSKTNIPPSVNPGHQLGRGVPDVAGVADPQTGVLVASPDGSVQPIGGTSATAPLWTALGHASTRQSAGRWAS